MDALAASMAMQTGDLSAWINALDWDERDNVDLDFPCPQGHRSHGTIVAVRKGKTILGLTPRTPGHDAAERETLLMSSFDTEDEAHWAYQVAVSSAHGMVAARRREANDPQNDLSERPFGFSTV